MHPLGQNGYPGYPGGLGAEQGGGGEGEGAKYSDINSILDQILNITDQSLDEAQVTTKQLSVHQTL
jgi:hypothetical protein